MPRKIQFKSTVFNKKVQRKKLQQRKNFIRNKRITELNITTLSWNQKIKIKKKITLQRKNYYDKEKARQSTKNSTKPAKWHEDGIGSLTTQTGTEQWKMQTLNAQGQGEQVETIGAIRPAPNTQEEGQLK